MLQDLKKISKELEEIFGTIAVSKVFSHIYSLERKIEDLIKSRDNWKSKYIKMLNQNKKLIQKKK